MNIKDFWYTRDEMKRHCEACGFKVEILEDWKDKCDTMVCAVLLENGPTGKQAYS